METKYYDIGLNLFTRSFPDPEKIIRNAEEAGGALHPDRLGSA